MEKSRSREEKIVKSPIKERSSQDKWFQIRWR